jgi:hypothetical protein
VEDLGVRPPDGDRRPRMTRAHDRQNPLQIGGVVGPAGGRSLPPPTVGSGSPSLVPARRLPVLLWGRVPMAGDLSLLERERPSSSSSAEEEEGPGKRKRVHREVAARPVLGTAAR